MFKIKLSQTILVMILGNSLIKYSRNLNRAKKSTIDLKVSKIILYSVIYETLAKIVLINIWTMFENSLISVIILIIVVKCIQFIRKYIATRTIVNKIPGLPVSNWLLGNVDQIWYGLKRGLEPGEGEFRLGWELSLIVKLVCSPTRRLMWRSPYWNVQKRWYWKNLGRAWADSHIV